MADLKEACLHGTIVASFAVQDFSVRNLETLNMTKVEKRLEEYKQVVQL